MEARGFRHVGEGDLAAVAGTVVAVEVGESAAVALRRAEGPADAGEAEFELEVDLFRPPDVVADEKVEVAVTVGVEEAGDPGEANADIYATLRLATSCMGRGFALGSACGGYGDPCISNGTFTCDGVRDMDFANHASGAPHTVATSILDTQATPTGGCQGFGSQFGPRGGEVHCAGVVPGEAVFDLLHRDLAGDFNTNQEIVTRLSHLGMQNVG
ncbi:MAG: hypothetical protein V3T72_02275, partial [Thermoanaerobaculia bacterium]